MGYLVKYIHTYISNTAHTPTHEHEIPREWKSPHKKAKGGIIINEAKSSLKLHE